MYCRKCSKEIKDDSKFCPYCGNEILMDQSSLPAPGKPELNSDTGTHTTAGGKEPPTEKKKVAGRPGWLIPLAVVSSVAVIGTAVYMGVRVMQEPAEATKQVSVDARKQEEESVDSVETVETVESAEPKQPEYPVDITLNQEEMKGIGDLLYLMGSIDITEERQGGIFSHNNAINEDIARKLVVHTLALSSSLVNGGSLVNGDAEYGTGSRWIVPKEILDQYLQNSINYQEYKLGEWDELSDGNVHIADTAPISVVYNETPQITRVQQISDEEIEVFGIDEYKADSIVTELYTEEFDVIMKKNPDSIWGGYTLTEIKSWGRQDARNAAGTTGDWKQAFINAINPKYAYKKTGGEYTESSIEENYDTYVAFKLWDMNKDGIPEVICSFGSWNSAGSGMLYAYNPQTNSVTENILGGRFFTYSGEELCATGSIGGAGHSTVYTLKNIYTQPLEADLTYGGLIQEIQNYGQ